MYKTFSSELRVILYEFSKFKTISVIILKTKIELLHQHDVIMTSAGAAVNSNQVDWSKGQQGPIVIVYLIS